jgi:hypothetical protein
MSVSLYGSGQIILQVVNATSLTQVSTTSTGMVTTGLTATITPFSTNSKILILADIGNCQNLNAGAMSATIYRGATNLATNGSPASFAVWYTGNSTNAVNLPVQFLDSPSTTSATTYTIYFCTSSGNTSVVMGGGITGTITLLEISGS